jgi:hypothetical protein
VTNRRSQAAVSAVEFIDKRIKLDEKGEPFTLAPYQRRVLEMALRRDPSGELVFRPVLLCPSSVPRNRMTCAWRLSRKQLKRLETESENSRK